MGQREAAGRRASPRADSTAARPRPLPPVSVVRLRYDTEPEITATTRLMPDYNELFETTPLESALAEPVVLAARARFEARERAAAAWRDRKTDRRVVAELALGSFAVLGVVSLLLYALFG